jgi:hypothetical protein
MISVCYEQVFDCWKQPEKMPNIISATLNNHIRQITEYDWPDYICYSIWPLEIQVLKKIRTEFGLETPMPEHQLLQSPLYKLEWPTQPLEPFTDNIYDRAQKHYELEALEKEFKSKRSYFPESTTQKKPQINLKSNYPEAESYDTLDFDWKDGAEGVIGAVESWLPQEDADALNWQWLDEDGTRLRFEYKGRTSEAEADEIKRSQTNKITSFYWGPDTVMEHLGNVLFPDYDIIPMETFSDTREFAIGTGAMWDRLERENPGIKEELINGDEDELQEILGDLEEEECDEEEAELSEEE